MLDSARILGEQGPYAKKLGASFNPRPQQQQMASSIDAMIEDGNGVLVAESGTGTGKTLAYLTPCLSSDKRVIISTATRHLQDQIFYKDLPLALKTLSLQKNVCLLKGRSNYLCLHRLHTQAAATSARDDQLEAIHLDVCQWSQVTDTGDVNDIEQLAENSKLRPLITSTNDNCLGSDCGHFEDCFVRKARKQALEADVIVVNHHLYFAHLLLQEDGFGQLLPPAQIQVFDEAHALPQIASNQLSKTISSRQIAQLIADLNSKLILELNTVDELFEAQQSLDKELMQTVRLFAKPVKQEAALLFEDQQIHQQFSQLLEQLETLTLKLKSRAEEKEFQLFYERALALAELLGECLYEEHDKDKYFSWIEAADLRFRLHQTPIQLDEFGQRLNSPLAPVTVLTSATLSSAGDFSFYLNQLALVDVQSNSWPSPFDYKNQCRMYLPQSLPDPRHPQFLEALLEESIGLINACQGRTFFLFTSHLAMENAFKQIQQRIKFPILKQGQRPKHELIEQFNRLGNAVLLGTSSFWEGVDVKGANLSCVIIDKLPFASPDDPVLKARMRKMESQGQNPFMHYQLPQMIITLKQGIGRLIRDESDKGVIMIADARLRQKAYGKRVLKALPDIPVSSSWADIDAFIQANL